MQVLKRRIFIHGTFQKFESMEASTIQHVPVDFFIVCTRDENNYYSFKNINQSNPFIHDIRLIISPRSVSECVKNHFGRTLRFSSNLGRILNFVCRHFYCHS